MLRLWNHTERFDCLRKVNSYKAPYYTTNCKRKVVDDLRKLNYYGNLEDEVVMNNINEDSKFESYGILSRIACGFEERNLRIEKCSEGDEGKYINSSSIKFEWCICTHWDII